MIRIKFDILQCPCIIILTVWFSRIDYFCIEYLLALDKTFINPGLDHLLKTRERNNIRKQFYKLIKLVINVFIQR